MRKEFIDLIEYHINNDKAYAEEFYTNGKTLSKMGGLIRVLHSLCVGQNVQYMQYKLEELTEGCLTYQFGDYNFMFDGKEYNISKLDVDFPLMRYYIQPSQCHTNCIRFARMNADIHGDIVCGEINPYQSIDGDENREKIFHVWMEMGNHVIDPTYNMRMTKKQYYEMFKAEPLTKLNTRVLRSDPDIFQYDISIGDCLEYLMDRNDFMERHGLDDLVDKNNAMKNY